MLPARGGTVPLLGAGLTATCPTSLTATLQGHTEDTSNSTTINYGSVAFGAVAANKVNILAVASRQTNTLDAISSVTVDGSVATLVTNSNTATPATLVQAAFYYVTGISHTSGTVQVVWSGASVRSSLASYSLQTCTPTPTSGANAAGAAIGLSKAVTVPASGIGLAIYGCRLSGSASVFTWVNTTAGAGDYLANIGGSLTAVGSSKIAATATISVSGTNCTTGDALSTATWGP